MRRSASGFVLGYHGCDAEIARKLLDGEPFHLSKNEYDWLGWGAYFWESDAVRAFQWAELSARRRGVSVKPDVVGAVIDLGLCLDLTTQASLDVIRTGHGSLVTVARTVKRKLPKNIDEFRRPLDCMVLNYLYDSMPAPKFQTVRGVFLEGGPLYPGGLIHSRTHVQLAVRDLTCIRGVFHVPPEELPLKSK